ncbi:tRNA1(Val) (adenine(37)-N6)-methyltransferase [Methylocapsa aurea]|uniref:tRNA1(Val) (adenine(37)-N6)-methyltransferase n=1 Tax=Methylocapsa aurea TaxID=663610 RepID=UPI00056C930C|nr:methyltransferase [Methylocapsa aurea]
MAEDWGEAAPPTATDGFLGGRLLLRQPRKGHRAGTDAVLLAAAAPVDFSGLAFDIGAGVGAAGLALALMHPAARIGLVENDPFSAALARDNLALNGLAERGLVFEADILSRPCRRAAGLLDESASLIITNPPFADPGRARLSPEPGKRRAHAMQAEGPRPLAAWIAASLALLEPGGSIILIHRPDALPAILESLAGRAGALTILAVHPRREKAAIRVLVRGRKGSRAPTSIAPPLILHEGTAFTAAAEALHQGAAAIHW